MHIESGSGQDPSSGDKKVALVAGLVAQLGGEVPLPDAGEGSLPAEPDEAAAGPAQATSGRRVLIIEDNLDIAESLQELIMDFGHETRIAGRGAEGVGLARSFHPDIVLCDIGLPGGMDGYAVARTLREDPALQGITLIALTGYGQGEDRRRVQEAGFDRHLIKPVDIGLLQSILGG
jgi:CheY-like chemotaxis protein